MWCPIEDVRDGHWLHPPRALITMGSDSMVTTSATPHVVPTEPNMYRPLLPAHLRRPVVALIVVVILVLAALALQFAHQETAGQPDVHYATDTVALSVITSAGVNVARREVLVGEGWRRGRRSWIRCLVAG